MTQAFNLAQFANNLNTSGATSNAGLQNSAVTVTAGTGMSGGGSVALGSSVTLTNAGVTSITNGGGLSISASTGAITITNSNTGTVTSVATGNGLQGGTITGSGTLSVACPTFNTVGSYSLCINKSNSSIGSNYSGWQTYTGIDGEGNLTGSMTLSGTWKFMGVVGSTLVCRVS